MTGQETHVHATDSVVLGTCQVLGSQCLGNHSARSKERPGADLQDVSPSSLPIAWDTGFREGKWLVDSHIASYSHISNSAINGRAVRLHRVYCVTFTVSCMDK